MTTRIGSWFAVALGTALAGVLVACGSGGGGGVAPPPQPSQAIYTTGPISGFGSVYVNGVRYATTNADIEVDGVAVALTDLRVGQVVDIRGAMKDGSASADVIQYHHNVEGPVTSIDVPGLSFVALGQTVLVGPDTSFGDGIVPSSIAGLTVGDVVQVSGLLNAAGEIEATRVDIRTNQGAYDVFGTVSGLDAAANTFFITGLKVDYSSANLGDFPSGAPEDGDLVKVTGLDFDAAASLLLATRVELRYDQAMLPDAGNTVHVEGLITRFVSATDFDVAGRPVTTTAATVYENGTVDDLALDVRVCVEGVLDAEGVLVANRVRFRPENTIRIVSTVETIDLDHKRFTVLGVTVNTDATTRFEDDSVLEVSSFSLADLHTGDWVEVRGHESPADSGAVFATRVERLDAQGTHQMRGPLNNVNRPDFDVLIVPVHTTDTTHFALDDGGGMQSGTPITADQFFAEPEGTLIEARGTWSGTLLTADTVVLKTSDD